MIIAYLKLIFWYVDIDISIYSYKHAWIYFKSSKQIHNSDIGHEYNASNSVIWVIFGYMRPCNFCDCSCRLDH